MKVVTAQQMREIDRRAIQEYGLAGAVLMNNAGRTIAQVVKEEYPRAVTVAAMCGTGNNGGDGYVAAYYLHQAGLEVMLFSAGDPVKMTESTRHYYDLCIKCGIPQAEILEGLGVPDVCIDALLGTGFSGEVRSPLDGVIEWINGITSTIVSADIPSGLPAQGPVKDDILAVEADLTVTMGFPKVNLAVWPGRRYAGHVITADIGFPGEASAQVPSNTELIDDDYARWYFPVLDESINKTGRGRVLVAGGCSGMEGAGLLAVKGALAAGSGLCHLLTDEVARQTVAGLVPECITHGYQQEKSEIFEQLFRNHRFNACVVGPGMGRSGESGYFFHELMDVLSQNEGLPVVLDADSLYHLSQGPSGLLPRGPIFIMTPHTGEAARLLNISPEQVEEDRVAASRQLAEQYGALVVLKGPGTIVTNGVELHINSTGNQGLATGGSGDVLSGIIAALASMGLDPLHAAALAVWAHGKAADLFYEEQEGFAMKAGDIIDYLPQLIL